MPSDNPLVAGQNRDRDRIVAWLADHGPAGFDLVAQGLGMRRQEVRARIRQARVAGDLVDAPPTRGIQQFRVSPAWLAATASPSDDIGGDGTDNDDVLADDDTTEVLASDDIPTADAEPTTEPTPDPEPATAAIDVDDTGQREAATLAALSDNPDGLTTTQIGDTLGATDSQTRTTINSLRDAGQIVEAGKDGRATIWAVA